MTSAGPATPDAWSAMGPQLITYADRFGGSLQGVRHLMDGPFQGAFAGLHILPFFVPYDGADAGFDPVDHTSVDSRLGDWQDITDLAARHTVMADAIVNHVSARSEAFRDVVERGEDSDWAPMFLTYDAVFPDGATEEDLTRIYRPRPGLPFTPMTLGGRQRLVWTTFTPEQIDLNAAHPLGEAYLARVLSSLTSAGVRMVRLDAAGYVGKRAGTDCFMTDEAYAVMDRLSSSAHEQGAHILVEVHGHHTQQIEIARRVDLVYDFALPPLVLHTLMTGDTGPLAAWLRIRPENAVTVLDTHDGIGVIDIGPSPLAPGRPGLLSAEQIDNLVETIHANSGGSSRLATGAAASNLDLYQVNCTFYDALGQNDRAYLLARLLQLFVPGIPQIYYVGLMAGSNDLDLLSRTGVGRDVNRHHYTAHEVEEALKRPVVSTLLDVLRARNGHPAFAGNFTCTTDGPVMVLRWDSENGATAHLQADVSAMTFRARFSRRGDGDNGLDITEASLGTGQGSGTAVTSTGRGHPATSTGCQAGADAAGPRT
ncbi:sucrose phosphorylase [Streptomyces shenzhenensis]|uniref:sucrose phosphorylase n=1 Tax=Streptomyces shenzhenensis TaxID=943815 RepID=UPI001F183464|nr:sucrose phosphorylase [Streptomyces shenzhenensis]